MVPMKQPFSYRFIILTFMTLAFGSLLFAHIRIAPTESTTGAREKYTMRVPNEKQVACSKIEGEFPAGLEIYDFEFTPTQRGDLTLSFGLPQAPPPAPQSLTNVVVHVR